jgi:hypothetical protein
MSVPCRASERQIANRGFGGKLGQGSGIGGQRSEVRGQSARAEAAGMEFRMSHGSAIRRNGRRYVAASRDTSHSVVPDARGSDVGASLARPPSSVRGEKYGFCSSHGSAICRSHAHYVASGVTLVWCDEMTLKEERTICPGRQKATEKSAAKPRDSRGGLCPPKPYIEREVVLYAEPQTKEAYL